MLLLSLENTVTKFVYLSLDHAGSEKCVAEIAHLLCKEPRQKGEEKFVLL
jgi:hypothetical protein